MESFPKIIAKQIQRRVTDTKQALEEDEGLCELFQQTLSGFRSSEHAEASLVELLALATIEDDMDERALASGEKWASFVTVADGDRPLFQERVSELLEILFRRGQKESPDVLTELVLALETCLGLERVECLLKLPQER